MAQSNNLIKAGVAAVIGYLFLKSEKPNIEAVGDIDIHDDYIIKTMNKGLLIQRYLLGSGLTLTHSNENSLTKLSNVQIVKKGIAKGISIDFLVGALSYWDESRIKSMPKNVLVQKYIDYVAINATGAVSTKIRNSLQGLSNQSIILKGLSIGMSLLDFEFNLN